MITRRSLFTLDYQEKRFTSPRTAETPMRYDKADMIKGTLDMLVLKVVSLEPMHGWGISERIQGISKDILSVNQGSLYAALNRLTRAGWIRSEWRVTEHNRRGRYYDLTKTGKKQLGMEEDRWRRLSGAVHRIMATA